jgi:hypothetical protein
MATERREGNLVPTLPAFVMIDHIDHADQMLIWVALALCLWRALSWLIRRLNAHEGQPAVVYLHPWEIDQAQPRLPMGRLARLRHSLNIDSTEDKLRRLLRDFSFGPAAQVLGEAGLFVPGSPR